MNKISRKIDSYLLALLLQLFIVVALFMLTSKENRSVLDFIMLCITFFTATVTYMGGIVVGLIMSSVAIFIYASYIFYINLVKGIEIGFVCYLWMISIPIVAFITGKLSSYISLLQENNINLRENYKNLITIDEQTGLGNIKLFYMDLEREMSKSKRHKTPCTLMLIKFTYYKDIKKIMGESRTNKLMKDISDLIIIATRAEDERYTIENDTLAIIMPSTDFKGAEVVKDRIKESLVKLNLELKEDKNYVSIDVKIAMLSYRDSIKTAMEFKMLTEEELQYDV